MSGNLNAVKNAITTRRAQCRAQHGWIMDIYLLRRTASAETNLQP